MERLRNRDIKLSNGFTFSIDVLKLCPYCGEPNRPVYISDVLTTYNKKTLILCVFNVECCDKNFFCTYIHTSTENGIRLTQFLCSYPNILASTLPEKVSSLSPRFTSLYNQSYTAENNGHIELAGSGYRNAIEILIKDYAIKILGKPESEVSDTYLVKAIEIYLPTVNIKNCADVIRLLGNDYTHYQTKYDGIEFDQLKKYLTLFISAIDADLMMREPIIGIPRKTDQ